MSDDSLWIVDEALGWLLIELLCVSCISLHIYRSIFKQSALGVCDKVVRFTESMFKNDVSPNCGASDSYIF